MCLAVPLKIIEVNGKTAEAEAMGVSRKIGDYVIVHDGFAIERLPESQALDDIAAWEELENALR